MTRGRCASICLAPKRVIRVSRPGSLFRVQHVHELLQLLVGYARADLHAHRIRDASEVLDVCAGEIRRAHADPREVRRQVVPMAAMLQEPRLRLLVWQMQSLVRRVELDSMRAVHRLTRDRFEKLERVGDRLHQRVVVGCSG